QKSQNAQIFPVQPGPSYRSYGLVMPEVAPGTHENDFFDGMDTSIVGLASRSAEVAAQLPRVREELGEIAKQVAAATDAEKSEPVKAALPLLVGRRLTAKLIAEVAATGLKSTETDSVLDRLREKEKQFQEAANLALSLSLQADLETPNKSNEVVPGEKFSVSIRLNSPNGDAVRPRGGPEWRGWKKQGSAEFSSVESSTFTVPADADYTRQYWHRKDPDKDGVFIVDEPK